MSVKRHSEVQPAYLRRHQCRVNRDVDSSPRISKLVLHKYSRAIYTHEETRDRQAVHPGGLLCSIQLPELDTVVPVALSGC